MATEKNLTSSLLEKVNEKYTEGNEEERKVIVKNTINEIEKLLSVRGNKSKPIIESFTESVLFFKKSFDSNESKNEFAGKVLGYFLNEHFDKLFKIIPPSYRRRGNTFSSKALDDLYEALLNHQKIEEEKNNATDEELRKKRKEDEKKRNLIEKKEKEENNKTAFLELIRNLAEKDELKKEQRRNIEEILQKYGLATAQQKLQAILHPNRDA